MRDYIEFIIDDQVRKISFGKGNNVKPSTTVLNFLRQIPGHLGVKEGCAEGDCGACTVVVASLNENKQLRYQTINSCLCFLPMLQGKMLITVENLHERNGREQTLHPVQEAMIETNGSQCGYCTPGIVMSLFGLYKNHENPSQDIIENSLVGNLCRCTGYQPIIEAAKKSCIHNGKDRYSLHEKQLCAELEKLNKDNSPIILESEKQQYIKVFTEHDALKFRSKYPSALIVSGATDVSLRQNKKHEHFEIILDISAVAEWSFVSEESDRFRFGAITSMEFIRQAVKGKFEALYSMLNVFGSLQVRNAASIGGNIGSASPIGDSLPVLFACDALVQISSAKGKRVIPIEQFIIGYRQTDLKQNELISEIIIPKPEINTIICSYKVSKRTDLDISIVSSSFRLSIANGVISNIVLAYGGMAASTQRAAITEKFLTGKEWNETNIEKAMKILEDEFSPISDARSESEYRRLICRNLLMKFYQENKNVLNSK